MKEAVHTLNVHLAGLVNEQKLRKRRLEKAADGSDAARALRNDLENLKIAIRETEAGLAAINRSSAHE